MAQTFEEALLQAIEKDDIKAFDALMEEAQCGAYRLGRFPVLSLLYLYSSRTVLSSYEEKFLKFSSWNELSEPASAVKLFSEKAGKCLRLYLNEVVSPLEMLLILDRTKKLKKIYPQTNPSKTVKSRLQTIYSLKYSLNIRFEGNQIIPDRRPLNGREKKRLITLCVSGALVAAIAVATPTTYFAVFGKRGGGDVTRLSHINFGAKTTYTLKNDITIPENYSVEKMNCTIIGGNHKLILGKNSSLGEFGGKLSDLQITTSGNPVFTVCTEDAELSNVTVNVNADVTTDGRSAFIAVENRGTFDNITLNVGGKISAVEGVGDELVFGGMTAANYNKVINCTVNYSNFSLTGELTANATFGGIAGYNYGLIQDCTVSGKITAHTFDLAGACYTNYYALSGVVNRADLSQTSVDDGWSPIVGGIVIDNMPGSAVEQCLNSGNLTVTGSDLAICGGISARSYGSNKYCLSLGDITVTANAAYAGGICAMSLVTRDGNYVYFGKADYCVSNAKIDLRLGDGTSYVGGIGGLVQQMPLTQYKTDDNGKIVAETIYLGGGVTNSFFTGEIIGDCNYRGAIVGVCGAEMYNENSYTNGGEEYHNFEGNYFLENTLPSFGAVGSTEEQNGETVDVFTRVEGKGATPSTQTDIENNKTFRDILAKFGL